MRHEPTSSEQRAAAAGDLAAGSRLLLKAGRLDGAAILHAEACQLLLSALTPEAALDRSDPLAQHFRAVWLDRPVALAPAPGEADLRAMEIGRAHV